jgi:hypothetical protein
MFLSALRLVLSLLMIRDTVDISISHRFGSQWIDEGGAGDSLGGDSSPRSVRQDKDLMRQ